MGNRLEKGMEKWGHYLLALLCAGVILLSAAWTRDQQGRERENQTALSDQSQRLSQAAPPSWLEELRPPVAGEVARPYSEEPVYFAGLNLWRLHRAVDFAAQPGETVAAVAEGTVTACGAHEVRLSLGEGRECLYRGLEKVTVSLGQRVRAGAALGIAGASVPFEDPGHICVTILENGAPAAWKP